MVDERQAVRMLTAQLRGDAERTAESLRQAARERGMPITDDDRIREGDLAALLGLSAGTLANRRAMGKSPPWYRIGRVTYRISEAALWIESQRTT